MKILHLKLAKPTTDPRSSVVRDLFSASGGTSDGLGAVNIELADDGVGFWISFSTIKERLWVPVPNVVSALFDGEELAKPGKAKP